MGYYIVRYRGPFGFIKPWCAVRDSKTFSQQFLTPSIIEGIRQKLEVAVVLRHKLTYDAISVQQERTQTRGWKIKKTQKLMVREQSILDRGVIFLVGFNRFAESEPMYGWLEVSGKPVIAG